MLKRLINFLFKVPCDNCGTYSSVQFIGTHGMMYKGKMVEDVCLDCESEIWDSID